MTSLQDKIDAIIERQHSLSDVKLLIAIDSNEIDKAIQELREEIMAKSYTVYENVDRDSDNSYSKPIGFAIGLKDVLALIGEKK